MDVAIVGAGPAGLTAARLLAGDGLNVSVFERKLSVGGGIWGGGMLFPRIVVQETARGVMEEVGIKLQAHDGYYVADSVETVAKCTSAAIDAGVKIWVGVSVEDVMIRENDEVCGGVINWGAVEYAGLHVDPLALSAKCVIDATGHAAEIARGVLRKIPGAKFSTEDGGVPGERPMAEIGEGALVGNTQDISGLVVAGMAANAVFASRAWADLRGMFLSGVGRPRSPGHHRPARQCVEPGLHSSGLRRSAVYYGGRFVVSASCLLPAYYLIRWAFPYSIPRRR